MELISEFQDKKSRTVQVFRLSEDSFHLVSLFYKNQLKRIPKEFFYPYKTAELKNILQKDKGLFLGAFHNKTLIGAGALDFDTEYGQKIKNLISKNKPIANELPLYEYSGLMVDKQYQQAGITAALFHILKQFAKENLNPCYLFATIHMTNYPSLKNAFGQGFQLFHIQKQTPFLFGQLLLPIPAADLNFDDSKNQTSECDITKQIELLNSGFVGFDSFVKDENVYISYKKICK